MRNISSLKRKLRVLALQKPRHATAPGFAHAKPSCREWASRPRTRFNGINGRERIMNHDLVNPNENGAKGENKKDWPWR